ncbi:hypothetical protein [Streptomyces sp. SM11]|uniref:hypothetical protein n=1 Tax=Streptomyces sp. SM11 TaxID=565557 RepID=UPI000CD4E85E|nr:hypothetical protein [Streptomyces sp. SM11]
MPDVLNHHGRVAGPTHVRAVEATASGSYEAARWWSARRPDTKYVGDNACLPVDGGRFCCPATVIDLASRRPAGRAIAGHLRADLVTSTCTPTTPAPAA